MLPRSNSGRCPGLRAAGAAVMLAALAACAVIAPQRAARAPGFDLVGRVAVTSPERAFSSSVRWSHRPGGDELWLLTPTGQAVAHIRAGDDGATLTTAERHEYSARDVEALTRRALGWALPMTQLAWWLRGEPVPGLPVGEAVRDAGGRLVRLQQDGWEVVLVHAPDGAPGAPPRRLELTRDASRVRLVVDGWQAAPAGGDATPGS